MTLPRQLGFPTGAAPHSPHLLPGTGPPALPPHSSQAGSSSFSPSSEGASPSSRPYPGGHEPQLAQPLKGPRFCQPTTLKQWVKVFSECTEQLQFLSFQIPLEDMLTSGQCSLSTFQPLGESAATGTRRSVPPPLGLNTFMLRPQLTS